MVLIAVSCDPSDITLLLEVNSFDQLKAEVLASFGAFLSEGFELDLYYHYSMPPSPSKQPQGGGGQNQKKNQDPVEVDISVRCQQGFEGFLKVVDVTPPVLLVRECEPMVLPTALLQGGGEEEQQEEEPKARKSVPSRKSAGPRKTARPVSAATAGRVAAAMGDEEEDGDARVEPSVHDERVKPGYDLTNRKRAAALLSSFHTPAEPEPERLRAVFRDGSASRLVAFNPFNPPMQYQLVDKIKKALEPLLDNSTREEASALADGGEPMRWMLAAYCPAVSSEYDLEDDRDVMHLARLVKEYGDLEVQILVDVTDEQLEHKNSSPERRSRMRDESSSLLTTQPIAYNLPSPERDDKLKVNLVHTPQKRKERAKELEENDKRDDVFSHAEASKQKKKLLQSNVD